MHNPELTRLESWCVDSIRTYNSQGGEPCMPADELAQWMGLGKRSLRRLINHLISREYHGLPIFPQPGLDGGYFIAETPGLKRRAGDAIEAQLKRAKTSAKKARDLGATDTELATGVVQLALDLGPAVETQIAAKLTKGRGHVTHKQVVRQLTKYAGAPDAFAAEIGELRKLFSGVFVRKEDLTRVMRKQTEAAIEAAVAELSGNKAA